ncbi:MAG TPA: 2-polyprenylphenol 6-hydroxylase [Caulobacteraceae bacterium]|nr:2-polyprenylphenol 6-hydroxylase [Caulobacteraceae bacterium]
MAGLGSFARLTGAAWTLVRADALAPREIDEVLPPGARSLARFLRLFAGPTARRGRPGERLARALESLGPVAIKLGQFLSTRADIFGASFAEDLSHLKDRLPPFPTEIARAETERALGRPLDGLLSRFEAPVAAASLAQAHKVVLLDGREAAVKVLRPGIEQRVAADVEAMTLAASLVEAWIPAARRLEPKAFAAIVIRALQLELDLRFEAAGADELRQVMANDAYMRAPAVVWEGVARRVLTLEWAQGLPLSEAAALEQPGLERTRLADNLIRAFLAQALDHGVFHADLHEGNLFIAPPALITAVDFGIIGRLGPGERRYLAEILWGFLQRDYERVAAVHFEAGYVPWRHDRSAFAQALRAVGEPVFGRKAADVSMGRLLAQLFEITALFDMRLRPELVLLQKTMVTVEGVARRIDPEHDIWAAAEPVVRRWIARELSPVVKAREFAREARAALTALARLAQAESAPPPVPVAEAPQESLSGFTGFLLGAAIPVLIFIMAWILMHGARG